MKRLRQFHCNAAWPPPVRVSIFAFVFLVFVIGIWLIGCDVPNFSEAADNAPFFTAAIGAAAALHALCRLGLFHPVCNLRYSSWLALSPWTAAKPLPLGPIHPVWQDAAVLAALARWPAHIDPALPLEAFGWAYFIGLTLLLAATATWPSLLLRNENWQMGAVIFAAMALVLWHGTRESLRRFPRGKDNRTHPGLAKPATSNSILQLEIKIEGVNATGTATTVGPFAQLSPKARFTSVSISTSFWVSLLLGW